MKLSVSLPDEDVEFLDSYVRHRLAESRSAALHDAVRLLRATGLGDDYASAWQEWDTSGPGQQWEAIRGAAR
ncbi:MAG: ribbon-helix-helix domain-containing protein [Dermatophilaceae bacterium]